MNRCALLHACLALIGEAVAQQPFEIDLSFRTQIDPWYVSSILPQADGRLLVSGWMEFPGLENPQLLARLEPNGDRDASFPLDQVGQGRLTAWEDRVYVGRTQIVSRILLNGQLDPSWAEMNTTPYFLSLQGGDYHVYPDGRILMSGVHQVNYPDSNWVGFYNLIWFSSEGYLDTTRAPRMGDGVIYRFKELPDGKFICTGPMSQFEGHPTSAIFRVHADGRLDTSFYTGVNWGQAFAYFPMADGKCVVGGLFRIAGNPDTLNLVRFMPDGSLDPTFDNGHRFNAPPPLSATYGGVVAAITPLDAGRLVVTGTFRNVDGIPRGSICLIDTAGQLLDDHFSAGGCGPHTYQGYTDAAIQDIIITDSVCYIWGDYHGYSDGTTNDPLQRFVTRLHGPDFSTHVVENVEAVPATLQILPNPAWSNMAIMLDGATADFKGTLALRDLTGRLLATHPVGGPGTRWVMDVGSIPSGTYLITLVDAYGTQLTSERLVVQH
jgi:uncharacterized delta-60 repeat protein